MSGAMLLRQNVREGSSPAKDEIARLKKVAAARDMLLMAKKLNSKSASELNKDQTWLSKLGSSMKNGDWTDVFTMGMQGIENQTELLGALRKAQGAKEDDSVPESLRRNPLDTLTPDEQGLIVAYSMLQEAYSMPDRSVSSMVGENLVSAIPTIIQMAYTGGAGAAVKASFSKIGKELIKKYGKNEVKKIVAKTLVRGTSFASQYGVRSLIGTAAPSAVVERKSQTTDIQAGLNEDGTVRVDRVNETEGWGEVAYKGLTSNFLEFAFEGTGG